jgi:hypothetical protein
MAYEVTVMGQQPTSSAAGNTINEISGYVHSRLHSNLIWMHEDGDANNPNFFIYGMSHSGQIRHIVRLTGTNLTAGQWEDIAIDDANGYIWVFNCGNNAATRATFQGWRFREPTTLAGNTVVDLTHSGAYQFNWSGYSGGRDCEAAMFDTTGRLYFINKETDNTGLQLDKVGIWRAPASLASWGTINTLQRITPDNWCRQASIAGADWARDNHAFYMMNTTDDGYKISTASPYNILETFTIRQPVRSNGTVGTSESLAVSADCTFLIRGAEGGAPEILRAELDNPPFGGDPDPVFPTFTARRATATTLAVKRA